MSPEAGAPPRGDATRASGAKRRRLGAHRKRFRIGGSDMSPEAGGAVAWRLGTCAADAPHCVGFAVQLRTHGRLADAPLRGDASRASDATRRRLGAIASICESEAAT